MNDLKEYIEDYDYEYLGSAFKKEEILIKISELSPNLILLDTEEKNLDLLELSNQFEMYNIPMITIIGEEFNESIDEILMSSPYGYLIKEIDKNCNDQWQWLLKSIPKILKTS